MTAADRAGGVGERCNRLPPGRAGGALGQYVTKPAIDALKEGVEALGGGGGVLAIVAISITFIGIICLVKLLKTVMVTKLENLFDRVLFASPVRGLVFGIFLTILVQSSSITTSPRSGRLAKMRPSNNAG